MILVTQELSILVLIPCQEVRLFSEFSGYRTAEFACESILHHSKQDGQPPVPLECSSADISANCRKIITTNSLELSQAWFFESNLMLLC